MTSPNFDVSLSIRSHLNLEELRQITGVEAHWYRPAGRVFPSGRIDDKALWHHYPAIRSTNSVSEELRSTVDWVSTFMPNEALEVRITVLLPSGGGGQPITLDGDVVADMLQLGASFEFDDVLITGDDEIDGADPSGRPLCRLVANTFDLDDATTCDGLDIFLERAARGMKVDVVVEEWEPCSIVADLVRAGVREMVLSMLGPWPAVFFETPDFPASPREWRLILLPSR